MAFDSVGSGGGTNGVRQFWFLLAGFAGGLVLIGVTIGVFIAQNEHQMKGHPLHANPYILAAIVVVLGCGGLIAAQILDRPLNGSSDSLLLTSYRTRFFLWIGVGDAPAFLGLAFAVATDRFWLYPVGVVFACVAYVRIAPTARHLARDQERITRCGSGLSLVSALSNMPARRPRR